MSFCSDREAVVLADAVRPVYRLAFIRVGDDLCRALRTQLLYSRKVDNLDLTSNGKSVTPLYTSHALA
jgi:hypothetical protein